jgi:hypothetical protein
MARLYPVGQMAVPLWPPQSDQESQSYPRRPGANPYYIQDIALQAKTRALIKAKAQRASRAKGSGPGGTSVDVSISGLGIIGRGKTSKTGTLQQRLPVLGVNYAPYTITVIGPTPDRLLPYNANRVSLIIQCIMFAGAGAGNSAYFSWGNPSNLSIGLELALRPATGGIETTPFAPLVFDKGVISPQEIWVFCSGPTSQATIVAFEGSAI